MNRCYIFITLSTAAPPKFLSIDNIVVYGIPISAENSLMFLPLSFIKLFNVFLSCHVVFPPFYSHYITKCRNVNSETRNFIILFLKIFKKGLTNTKYSVII